MFKPIHLAFPTSSHPYSILIRSLPQPVPGQRCPRPGESQKNHPQNSLHPMPVYCISIFSAQQHLFGIWTQGEPLKVLWRMRYPHRDTIPTPGHGTHTGTWYPHWDAVPTPCPALSLPAPRHAVASLPALAAAVSPRVCVYHHLVKGLFSLRFPRSPDLFVLGSRWLAAIP